jgi:hypothetical protein
LRTDTSSTEVLTAIVAAISNLEVNTSNGCVILIMRLGDSIVTALAFDTTLLKRKTQSVRWLAFYLAVAHRVLGRCFTVRFVQTAL